MAGQTVEKRVEIEPLVEVVSESTEVRVGVLATLDGLVGPVGFLDRLRPGSRSRSRST